MERQNDPYAEGYDAGLAGQSETANPYDLDTQEADHMSWNDGYMAAEADAEEGNND